MKFLFQKLRSANIIKFGFILCKSCHFQMILKSQIVHDISHQLRFITVGSQFHSINAMEKENILSRPEVKNYVQYISDEYVKCKDKGIEDSPVVRLIMKMKNYEEEIKNLRTLVTDGDKDMQKLVETEEHDYKNKINEIVSELLVYVNSDDHNDCRNATIEVHPGLGGQEAKLFAEELFDMYVRYANFRKWNILYIDKSPAEMGGIQKAEACFLGESVFKDLKHEAGIHRVQRVPVTEKSGKVQTSTCKINVLPCVDETEIILTDKDVKVETKHSSGPGGQNVNKNETCVRITHIATGIVVESQAQRSQVHNKRTALTKLRNILYQEKEKKTSGEIKNLKNEQLLGPMDKCNRMIENQYLNFLTPEPMNTRSLLTTTAEIRVVY